MKYGIAVGIAALIAVGAGAWFYTREESTDTPEQDVPVDDDVQEAPVTEDAI